jgi:NADH:ubiquinone oxidoreductase subunit H
MAGASVALPNGTAVVVVIFGTVLVFVIVALIWVSVWSELCLCFFQERVGSLIVGWVGELDEGAGVSLSYCPDEH